MEALGRTLSAALASARARLVVGIFALTLSGLPGCNVQEPPASPPSKAGSPLSVAITPLGTPELGQPLELSVTVTSRVALSAVELDIRLSDNLPLLEGSLRWQGTVTRVSAHEQRLTVLVPSEEIGLIRAAATFSDGQIRFAAGDTMKVGREPAPAGGVDVQPRTVPPTEGRPVIEYPAE